MMLQDNNSKHWSWILSWIKQILRSTIIKLNDTFKNQEGLKVGLVIIIIIGNIAKYIVRNHYTNAKLQQFSNPYFTQTQLFSPSVAFILIFQVCVKTTHYLRLNKTCYISLKNEIRQFFVHFLSVYRISISKLLLF